MKYQVPPKIEKAVKIKALIVMIFMVLLLPRPVSAFGWILGLSMAESAGKNAARKEMMKTQNNFYDYYGWCIYAKGTINEKKLNGVGEKYLDPTYAYSNNCLEEDELWAMRDVIRRKNDLYRKIMNSPLCK